VLFHLLENLLFIFTFLSYLEILMKMSESARLALFHVNCLFYGCSRNFYCFPVPQLDLEQKDPRGRTPLHLAVTLSHHECVKILLANKCNANAEHEGWSVVQEAVCSGNAQILSSVLELRDLQRHIQRVSNVPQLLERLLDAPDFYIEMKWEFTSWGK
jgi:hypothetical protein